MINHNNRTKTLFAFHYDYKNLLTEVEEGNEYSNYELFTEVGQLTNKYMLSISDVKDILTIFDTSFDVNGFLQSTHDEW